MADLTGQLFGNYRLVHLLGQGGFADVYLGKHIHLDSQAAIKILQARLVGTALEQFRNEGRSIASLAHPNIVRVFDFGIENGIPFLVMDYAPNGTLRQRYPKGTVLSPVSILPHVKQVAQALHYAHGRKLIHRDIKPENMLIGANGEVLLSDFGLVLPAQSTGSQTTKEMAGTLPYMAPEQINGKPRPASDQYALAIVMYEWLSGKRPFDGTFVEVATQHMMTPPEPLYGRIAGVSLAVQEVLFTALAKDPSRRFASIQAFATAFESACRIERISSSPSLPTIANSVPQIPADPSAAPTYVKTPAPSSPQHSPVLNTPSSANDWAQQPTINALSDPSTPTYVKTPASSSPQHSPVLNTPGSPQELNVLAPTAITPPIQPFNPVTPPVPISATWPETQLTPPISSGQTQSSQRKGRRVALVVLLCFLLATLVGGGLAYAVVKGSGGGPGTSGGGPGTSGNGPGGPVAATSATVTITPASSDLQKTYTITAVTGTPDTSQHQVAARVISVTTQVQSTTVNATGQGMTSGTHATGTVEVNNCDSSNPLTLPTGYTSTNTNGDGTAPSSIVMVLDAPVSLPTGVSPTCVSATIPGHIQQVGPIGNFSQYIHSSHIPTAPFSGAPPAFAHFYGSCPGYCWAIFNTSAFTGGTNPQPYTTVAQSDIDNAANSLTAPDATQTVQGQIHANERLVGAPTCKPNVQANHHAGDQATSVTVTVSYTCTGEVYDQDGTLAAATQWLKDDATKNPGTGYVLVGQIKTTMGQAQISDASQGTVSISVATEGIWVYQFSDAQKAQLAQALAGKSKSDAQTFLQNQQSIKQADIQLTGNGSLLPNDSHQITIVVQNVSGL